MWHGVNGLIETYDSKFNQLALELVEDNRAVSKYESEVANEIRTYTAKVNADLKEKLLIDKPISNWAMWRDFKSNGAIIQKFDEAGRKDLVRVEYRFNHLGRESTFYILKFQKNGGSWNLADGLYFYHHAQEYKKMDVSRIKELLNKEFASLSVSHKEAQTILPNLEKLVLKTAEYKSKMLESSIKYITDHAALSKKRYSYAVKGGLAAVILGGIAFYQYLHDDSGVEETLGLIHQECEGKDEGCVIRLLSSQRVSPKSVHVLAKAAKKLMKRV